MKQPFGGRVTRYAFIYALIFLGSSIIPVLYLLMLYMTALVKKAGAIISGQETDSTLFWSSLAGTGLMVVLLYFLRKAVRHRINGRFVLVGWHFLLALFLFGMITGANNMLGKPVDPEAGQVYVLPLLLLGAIYSLLVIGISYCCDLWIVRAEDQN